MKQAGMQIAYSGVDITQWMYVQMVQRDIGTKHASTMQKVGVSDGQMSQYMSRDVKTIVVTGIVMNDDLVPLRRSLAAAIDTDEPQQLIFGDEPDKYYLAIVDSQPTFTEGFRSGTISITFICPDGGIAHAVATQTADNIGDDGTLNDEISVQNDGTYPVYPVIDATMRGDNGVLTLINENNGAILQFGNPGEVDGVQAPDSETVFHYNLMSAPSGVAVNTGTINYPTYPYGSSPGPNTIAGSWDYAKAKDAATPILNRTQAMHWAGPTYHGPIKANAAGVNTGNLIWSNRFNVITNVGALGRVEFNLQSGSNIAICFVMRDNTYAADTLIVEGWVNGNNVFKQNLNRALFTNGMYEIVESKLGNTTTFRLTKVKQLNASGIVSSAQTVFPPVTIDGMADMSIDSFTVWMAGFSNTTGWTINWSDSVFQWVNVNYWKDLPNRFTDGDVVQVDVPNRRVFVNGAEDPTLQTIGNNWGEFKVQPGSNTIKLLTSSWAKQCEAEISWQEAWL